jgi:hypothetical protein
VTLSLETVITRATLREIGACWSSEQVEEFVSRHGESMSIGAVLSCEGITAEDRVWCGCAMLARQDLWLAFDAALEFARGAIAHVPASARDEVSAILAEVATLRGADAERCARAARADAGAEQIEILRRMIGGEP